MTASNEHTIDYKQPLASVLKAATAVAHESAEHSQGASWLTRGELDKDEYVRFLMMLWHVYSALETALDKHSTHPVLSPTYNPTLLARVPSLESDIAYLLDVPENSWRKHPIHVELLNRPPASLGAYVERIRWLSDDEDPSPLLAHAYVRYLGDLSGGQVIRRNIAKAYGLAQEDGLGTRFYEFKELGGNKQGTIGDMRKIKQWFRDGMNQGGGDDEARKKAISEEAVNVFELNEGLFTVLKAPSSQTSAQTPPEVPLLGNPTATPSPPPSPIVVAQNEGTTEKTYSLSSILAVVLAMSLAHFALVVGGFTGEKGYAKFQAVQQWIDSFVH